MNKYGNVIDMKIVGITCDNPDCNYSDMSVPFEDYAQWINHKCPCCDWNLLTKEDYNKCIQLKKIVNIFNKILNPVNFLLRGRLTQNKISQRVKLANKEIKL